MAIKYSSFDASSGNVFSLITITGQSGVFTSSLSGQTITGNTAGFTTITGGTVTGTTSNFDVGNFTTAITGVTVTGTTANFATGNFSTRVSGVTVTGTSGLFTVITGNTAGFTTVTGTTVTGTTANFAFGRFTSAVTGTTVTGTTANFDVGNFTTAITGTTVTGTTANFATGNFSARVSGVTVTGTSGLFTVISGGTAGFTTVTGTTVTGTSGNFVTGVFSSGLTVTTGTLTAYNTSVAAISVYSGGVCQTKTLVLGAQTTGSNATVLVSATGAAGTGNQVILPNNSAYLFKGSLVAGVSGAGNSSAWEFRGAIKRGATAASTALVGTVILDNIAYESTASGWGVAVTADTTNGGVKVEVTGQASTTIRWACKMETTEIGY